MIATLLAGTESSGPTASDLSLAKFLRIASFARNTAALPACVMITASTSVRTSKPNSALTRRTSRVISCSKPKLRLSFWVIPRSFAARPTCEAQEWSSFRRKRLCLKLGWQRRSQLRPNLFRQERHDGMKQANDSIENQITGCQARNFARPQAWLDHFQVPIAELRPNEVINLPSQFRELITLKRLIHAGNQLIEPRQNPRSSSGNCSNAEHRPIGEQSHLQSRQVTP